MIDAITANVRLDIRQGHDGCLVKLNGQLIQGLEAVSVTVGPLGTVATLMFSVDELEISHELNRLIAGQVDPATVQIGN